MRHTKRQLEKFTITLRDYELYAIEDALVRYRDSYPEQAEHYKLADKIINKLYSEAHN